MVVWDGDVLMKNAVSDTLKSGFTKLLGLKIREFDVRK